MAYYSSNNHESYFGDGYRTPYSGNYGVVPWQALMADSSHEFSNQNFFDYSPTPYYDAYDPAASHSVVSYSVSTFSEPKSVVYDLYSNAYSPAVTEFRISYSVSETELNDAEFEEYDPTPYEGGYDIAKTYGEALPPSEKLCYPRSMPDSSALSSNNVTLASIESPYGKEDADESAAKPYIETKQTPSNEDKQQFRGDDQNKEYDNTHGSLPEKLSGLNQAGDGPDNYCDDNAPWSDHESGYNEGNSYEYEKKVPQIPSGYGLEAMDLCESLFGYWPCLAKNNKRGHDCQEIANQESSWNQWKETADYLFGSSNPYGERRDGGYSYGDTIYGYEKHYPRQPLHRQVEYHEDYWMQKFNIF